jgi:hypothetical protein
LLSIIDGAKILQNSRVDEEDGENPSEWRKNDNKLGREKKIIAFISFYFFST